MIIVKLMGGLGNQMFQYAFAKQLAIKHGVKIGLDLSELNNTAMGGEYSVRDLGLNNFNVNFHEATKEDIAAYKKSKFSKMIDLILLTLGKNKLYIREPSFVLFKNALKAPKDCYLDGYWQSEKYFLEVRERLLADFTLKSGLSEESKRIAEKIRSTNAVSIHVRKGDYLSIAHNQNLYAICDEAYYSGAIKRMTQFEKEPSFFVFSDEPDWFKKNVKTTFPVEYVTHNTGKNSYQDLYLMSLCKHNIIANSSFSWWGAWLNKNEEKKIIAPEVWFKNNVKNTKDLIPASWIRL